MKNRNRSRVCSWPPVIKSLLAVVAIVLLIMPILSACSERYADILDNLRSNERLWQDKAISNYRYTLSIEYEPERPETPTPPVVITVRDGKAQSVVYQKSGESADWPGYLYDDADNIDKLFDLVRQRVSEIPYKIFVFYDDTFGYPNHILYEFRNRNVGSEIYEYNIIDFKVID